MSWARGDPPQTDSTIAPRRRRTVLVTASTSPLNTPLEPSSWPATFLVERAGRDGRGVCDERAEGMSGRVAGGVASFQQKFQKFIRGPVRTVGSTRHDRDVGC